MSLIDWSDPDEMLGLLVEYVADEASASHGDPDRERFLRRLSRELRALSAEDSPTAEAITRSLRALADAQPGGFERDPVMAHVEACIEELRRIETTRRRSDGRE